MFKQLMNVIGRVLGTTQPVTPVFQTQDGLNHGNNNTAKVRKSVSKELKPKRKAVKAAILAPSPTIETLCAPTRTKKSSTTGTLSATPARQSAKQKPKHKPSAAPSTTVAASRKQTQKAVQAELGQDGKQLATPASKTRQPAQQVKTKKQKAAVSTTQAKKGTQSKTPAQTRTARPSKARGS